MDQLTQLYKSRAEDLQRQVFILEEQLKNKFIKEDVGDVLDSLQTFFTGGDYSPASQILKGKTKQIDPKTGESIPKPEERVFKGDTSRLILRTSASGQEYFLDPATQEKWEVGDRRRNIPGAFIDPNKETLTAKTEQVPGEQGFSDILAQQFSELPTLAKVGAGALGYGLLSKFGVLPGPKTAVSLGSKLSSGVRDFARGAAYATAGQLTPEEEAAYSQKMQELNKQHIEADTIIKQNIAAEENAKAIQAAEAARKAREPLKMARSQSEADAAKAEAARAAAEEKMTKVELQNRASQQRALGKPGIIDPTTGERIFVDTGVTPARGYKATGERVFKSSTPELDTSSGERVSTGRGGAGAITLKPQDPMSELLARAKEGMEMTGRDVRAATSALRRGATTPLPGSQIPAVAGAAKLGAGLAGGLAGEYLVKPALEKAGAFDTIGKYTTKAAQLDPKIASAIDVAAGVAKTGIEAYLLGLPLGAALTAGAAAGGAQDRFAKELRDKGYDEKEINQLVYSSLLQ